MEAEARERNEMNVDLTEQQCADLRDLLRETLGDLSSEIAGTDNPGYRQRLRSKRESLEDVLSRLAPTEVATVMGS
jgi:hypothetical protein